jgi:uncharacterized membrane protein YphA (DoxX/SURF4 family)
MRFRDRLALAVSPVLLRLLLGVTFLWVGLGALVAEERITPEQSAVLANMGVSMSGSGATRNPPPDRAQPYDSPLDEAPPGGGSGMRGQAGHEVIRVQSGAGAYTPADFLEGARVRRLYLTALSLHAAANPGFDGSGQPLKSLWPRRLSERPWPVALAWTAAIFEVLGSLSILVGLLARLWASGLAVLSAGVLWIMHIGPALQTGNAVLGFLPAHAEYDQAAWMPILWHMALLLSSTALALSGAGAVSLDRALFARAPAREEGEGEGDEAEE